MKKTLIAFAALSAIAGVAQAQSTVTLYGLLDAYAGSVKSNSFNAPVAPATVGNYSSLRQTVVNSGGLNGSRFGFRITEDLGGGLAAIGNLEGGVSLDTGASAQGGLLFGRQANVGLASASLGTLTIGRNKSPYYDIHSGTGLRETIFDVTGGGSSALAAYNPTNSAGAATLLGNRGPSAVTWLGSAARVDNSLRYTSPSFSGFSVSGLYGFGENKTATADASQTYAASARYSNGPIDVYLAYQSEASARTATLKPALENTMFGGSYDFGVAKVGAVYNRAKLKDVTTTSAFLAPVGSSIDPQKEYGFTVAVPFGATVIEANYGQSKGDTLGKATGYGVQALYSLSKRTTLYTGFSSTKAYDRLAQLSADAAPGSSIERTQIFAVGARHTF